MPGTDIKLATLQLLARVLEPTELPPNKLYATKFLVYINRFSRSHGVQCNCK